MKVSDPRKDLVDKYNAAVADWEKDGGSRDTFKTQVTPIPSVYVDSKVGAEVQADCICIVYLCTCVSVYLVYL